MVGCASAPACLGHDHGIWATGPFFMMLAVTFTPGEGFHQAGAIIFTTIGLIVFAFSHWSFANLS
jgi:hypothetical protein